MSRGMTIADLVQKVYYAIYKVRLDVEYADELPEAFHADTDKFKEVVMEANFVLEELQKEGDWNFLRARLGLGTSQCLPDGRIMEIELPDWVYKPATGFNDAVRLHCSTYPLSVLEVPWTSPRSGNTIDTMMFDDAGRANVADLRLRAFLVGRTITFSRPFLHGEAGLTMETDVIRLLDPLHICGDDCTQPCPRSYVDTVLTQIPDPNWVVLRTAEKRAEGDPGAVDRVQSLNQEAMRMLSAMRENDSAKTIPDTYKTAELGYTRVL